MAGRGLEPTILTLPRLLGESVLSAPPSQRSSQTRFFIFPGLGGCTQLPLADVTSASVKREPRPGCPHRCCPFSSHCWRIPDLMHLPTVRQVTVNIEAMGINARGGVEVLSGRKPHGDSEAWLSPKARKWGPRGQPPGSWQGQLLGGWHRLGRERENGEEQVWGGHGESGLGLLRHIHGMMT